MNNTIEISYLCSFFHEIGKLKQLKRAGWIRHAIKNPESVADHSFRLSIMATLLAPMEGLNIERCTVLALIHDLGESQIGDITPYHPISHTLKQEMENNAWLQMTKFLPNQEKLLVLWQEFQDQKTLESQFIHQLDKLEMVLQAVEYQKNYPNAILREFWESTQNIWTFPILKEMYQYFVQTVSAL